MKKKPIYRKHTKLSSSKFEEKSREVYDKVKEELRKLKLEGKNRVTTDTLHMYIARHTWQLSRNWKRKARMHYFSYIIKCLEGAGILRYVGEGGMGVWEIQDKVL